MKSIAAYLDPVEGSRAEAIGRARRKGRYERVPGRQIVTGCNRHSRTLYVLTSGGSTVLSLDLIAPEERLRLYRQAPDGLEPLAVWLGNDGMPKQAHSWEKTFQAANARIARAWAAAHGKDPADIDCPLWARPHMARHSFALRWFGLDSVSSGQRDYTLHLEPAFPSQLADPTPVQAHDTFAKGDATKVVIRDADGTHEVAIS